MGSDNSLLGDDKQNKTEPDLKTKLKKHKSKNVFICSDCGKQLKTKSELKQHMNSKCGTIRLFMCKICGQELMTAGSLHNHMLRHNGEPNFMCRFCAKMFLTAGQLKVHERIHTQEKVYICQVCGKGFCHRQSLCTHMTLHTGVKPYQCENCGDAFSCIGNLIKHRKTHSDSCGLTPLATHRVNHPSTRQKVKINTPATTKLKSNKVNQSNHIETPNDRNLFDLDDEINEHATEQKDDKEEVYLENTDEVIIKQEFFPADPNYKHGVVQNDWYVENTDSLAQCSTSFNYDNIQEENNGHKNKDDYNNCISDHIEKPAFQNELKVEELPNEPTIDVHDDTSSENNKDLQQDSNDHDSDACSDENQSKELHSLYHAMNFRKRKKDSQEYLKFIIDRDLENKKSEACLYCNKKYSNFRWLFKHEQEHKKVQNSDQKNGKATTSKLYKCSCCKSTFPSKTDCRSHQASAHADILTCTECERIFANVDSLRSHQNTCHKGVPRKVYLYICKKCGYQFKQKAQLLLHEKHNCDEGPHIVCEICKKQFTSVHTRQAHMKLHDPEKKLLCKYCGKSFHWKGQLKIHERSHTGEKPFTCLYCPRAFAYRESLITHSSLHTGIKPYLCEACGWRFSCIGNLIKHRSTHASTCGVWYAKNKSENVQS